MHFFITRNYTFCSINCLNYLNALKKCIPVINNFYPVLKIKNTNAKLQKVTTQAIFKYFKHCSFMDLLENKLCLKKGGYSQITLKTMDDITELADLAEEPEVSEENEQVSINFDEEFTESDDESTEQEFDKSISIEKVPHKENHYQHSFHINRNYYKHIVGSKGKMLQKLCSETKTIIHVSKKKKHVVIIGSVQKRIIHAKRRIDKLIESSQNKLRFTHFISIPTNTDDIKENFIKFKEDVLKNCDLEATGFHENMFQKPEKLHLTISMLHLLEESDQQKAIEALSHCKEEIINPILNKNGPISIEFKGLTCMEHNPAKAKILYIKVHEETGLLQQMSNAVNEYFIEQGLSRRQHDQVTLHMTVINTFYLQRKKQKNVRKNFDATSILNDHQNTCLGKINLSTFHLSKLTAKSADGYFEATSKIQF